MPEETTGIGPVTPRGRVPFVWVEDDDTGHRYDVPEYAILPGMTRVDGYDLNWTGSARPTKYRTGKAPEPQARVDEPSGDAVAAAKANAKNAKAGVN